MGDSIETRLHRLERKIDFLFEHLGINWQNEAPVDDYTMQQVRDLLHRRKKIHAVKLMREATGWGLKEAKEYVDQLENDMR